MLYVFVDTNNGGTPSNATPDTSTSKYHTTSAWPANGARYSTLSGVAGDTTLQALTDDVTIYCIGTVGAARANFATGWSCASLTIIGDANKPYWDTSKFTVNNTGSTGGISVNFSTPRPVTIRNVQIYDTSTVSSPNGITIGSNVLNSTIRIDGCYIRIEGSGTGEGYAIYFGGVPSTVDAVVSNCIVVQYGTPGGVRNGVGQLNTTTAFVKTYNCVAYGFSGGYGFGRSAAAIHTAKNCVSFNNATDWNVTTLDHNASDDGGGTNALTGRTWANEFVDHANGDFTLKAGATLINAGVNDPASGAYSTDITGTTRTGTWDIGAFEYVGGGGTGLSITSVTPPSFDDGHTGIVIAGTGFGSSQGSSTLKIGAQAQTVTAWSDTSITFTCVRGANSMGSNTVVLTKG